PDDQGLRGARLDRALLLEGLRTRGRHGFPRPHPTASAGSTVLRPGSIAGAAETVALVAAPSLDQESGVAAVRASASGTRRLRAVIASKTRSLFRPSRTGNVRSATAA